ncbi:MAG TPA: hypothetical protein VKT30_18935 [Caulobacteraceae bacterium]|nr:hypothetical protein [Caulobacteraceae bacterium]
MLRKMAGMAAAPGHDERDRVIAALQAEVAALKGALLRQAAARQDASDAPLFGRGLPGGYLGGLEVAVGAFALLVLLAVFHQLTCTP